MVSCNQRSIYEGLGKVVGSSNRGFASLDPERQCGILIAAGKPAPAPARPQPFAPIQTRENGVQLSPAATAPTGRSEGGTGRR